MRNANGAARSGWGKSRVRNHRNAVERQVPWLPNNLLWHSWVWLREGINLMKLNLYKPKRQTTLNSRENPPNCEQKKSVTNCRFFPTWIRNLNYVIQTETISRSKGVLGWIILPAGPNVWSLLLVQNPSNYLFNGHIETTDVKPTVNRLHDSTASLVPSPRLFPQRPTNQHK